MSFRNTFICCLWLSLLSLHHSTYAEQPQFDVYFEDQLHRYSSLNPAGTVIAKLARKGEHYVINFERSLDSTAIGELSSKIFGGDDSYVRKIAWIDNDSLFVSMVKSGKAIANLVDTKKRTRNFVVNFDITKKNQQLDIRIIKSKGLLVDSLPNQDDTILFAKVARTSKVYQIDTSKLYQLDQRVSRIQKIDGGQFIEKHVKAKRNGMAIRWLTDQQGAILSVLYFTDDALVLSHRTNLQQNWLELKRWDRKAIADEKLRPIIPIALASKSSQFYAIETDQNEQKSLVLYDFSDDSKVELFAREDCEIINLLFDAKGDQLLSLIYVEDGNVEMHYFNAPLGKTSKKLSRKFKGQIVTPINMNISGSRMIVKVLSDVNPGDEYLADQKGNILRKVTTIEPWISRKNLVKQQVKTINVDGLDIEYILTRKKSKSRLPLIVMPHGGPFGVIDHKLFNPVTQYFAGNNFAVLQVNYRGSSGYGNQFREEGKKQFGNMILQDIEAAVADVSQRSDIDSNKICIYGASYGGYAAMMLPIRKPDLYSCSASFAGVTDISLLYYSNKRANHPMLKVFLQENIGDLEKEYNYFKSISPLYNIDKLDLPLMLIHGDKDDIVDVEHAFRMQRVFEANQKPIDFTILNGVGHGFKVPEQRKAFYAKLLKFFNQHLYNKT